MRAKESTPSSPVQPIVPRLKHEHFPRLNDQQWRERSRTLRRLNAKYFRERAEAEARAQCVPHCYQVAYPAKPTGKSPVVIDFVQRSYAWIARDERRQARRAEGKFV